MDVYIIWVTALRCLVAVVMGQLLVTHPHVLVILGLHYSGLKMTEAPFQLALAREDIFMQDNAIKTHIAGVLMCQQPFTVLTAP